MEIYMYSKNDMIVSDVWVCTMTPKNRIRLGASVKASLIGETTPSNRALISLKVNKPIKGLKKRFKTTRYLCGSCVANPNSIIFSLFKQGF